MMLDNKNYLKMKNCYECAIYSYHYDRHLNREHLTFCVHFFMTIVYSDYDL